MHRRCPHAAKILATLEGSVEPLSPNSAKLPISKAYSVTLARLPMAVSFAMLTLEDPPPPDPGRKRARIAAMSMISSEPKWMLLLLESGAENHEIDRKTTSRH